MKSKIIVGLLILGVISSYAVWNSFSKEWYEDCNSEIMMKNYTKNFELTFGKQYGENSTKAELISGVEEISKNPLKCKVTLHFRIVVSTFVYHEGTISTITRINGVNKETGIVNQDIFTLDEHARTHNVLKEVMQY